MRRRLRPNLWRRLVGSWHHYEGGEMKFGEIAQMFIDHLRTGGTVRTAEALLRAKRKDEGAHHVTLSLYLGMFIAIFVRAGFNDEQIIENVREIYQLELHRLIWWEWEKARGVEVAPHPQFTIVAMLWGTI